jgi:hypothetical protein
VDRHVRRAWSAAELAPPPGESWEHVGDAVARFVAAATAGGHVG